MKALEDAVMEMKFDTKKAPLGRCAAARSYLWSVHTFLLLIDISFTQRNAYFTLGKLSADQIKAGNIALKKIETCLGNNDYGTKLVQACDEFYTRIPHDFGSVDCLHQLLFPMYMLFIYLLWVLITA